MMTVAEVPGVSIASKAIVQPNDITIDLRQHTEAFPVLKKLGCFPKHRLVLIWRIVFQ